MEGLYIWLICAGVPLLFGLWAQMRVKSTVNRNSQVPTRNGLTGAQAAEAFVRYSGLDGVTDRPVPGHLTDQYDPRSRTLMPVLIGGLERER